MLGNPNRPVSFLFILSVVRVATAATLAEPCSLPSGDSLKEGSDHSILAEVLTAHVSPGRIGPITSHLVNYDGIRADPSRLMAYLRQLCDVKEAELKTWNPANALALLINAYNAMLLAMVAHYNPAVSVRDIVTPEGSVWKHAFLTLGGVKVSPDAIEHTMIRGMDGGFGYANKVGKRTIGLIHAGVVCASLSCPDLQLVPFKGSTVVEQLTTSTKAWLSNPTKNPGLQDGILKVSKIFSWYAGDFASAEGTVHAHLQRYAPASWGTITDKTLSYVHYDWNLNKLNGTASRASSNAPAVGKWLSIVLALVCSFTSP